MIWISKFSLGFETLQFKITPFSFCHSIFTKAKFSLILDWLNKYMGLTFICETDKKDWIILKHLFYLQLNPVILDILFVRILDKRKR